MGQAEAMGRRIPTRDRESAQAGTRDVLDRLAPLVAAAVLAIFLLPWAIQGKDAVVRVHDHLDSDFTYRLLLIDSGTAFELDPTAPVPQVMNGLPRAGLPTFADVYFLLVYLLGPIGGFVVDLVAIRLLGFWGMNRLLRDYFLKDDARVWPRVGVSLAFCLLPVFPFTGLAMLGLPLLLHVFLDLAHDRGRWTSFAWIVLFAAWSQLVHVGVFVLVFLGGLFLYFSIVRRRIPWKMGAGVALLAVCYPLCDFYLVYVALAKPFEIHRSSFVSTARVDAGGFVCLTVRRWLTGHYHSGQYNGALLYGFAAIALAARFLATRRVDWRVVGLAALGLVVACLAALPKWSGFFEHVTLYVPFLLQFQVTRFHYLLPPIAFLTFALALRSVPAGLAGRTSAVLALAALVAAAWLGNHSFDRNGFFNYGVDFAGKEAVTFREFFDEQQFAAIRRHIGLPPSEYRVASLGIEPAAVQANGFYTLDGYQNLYPLSYHERFRRAVGKEFEKSRMYARYGMRNRAYLVAAESEAPDFDGVVHRWEPDVEQLAELGCRYIFSRWEIGNAASLGLELEGRFPGLRWPVLVYRLEKSGPRSLSPSAHAGQRAAGAGAAPAQGEGAIETRGPAGRPSRRSS